MSIAHKTDYVAEGTVTRMLEMYKDKPRIIAFATSLLREIQGCEDRLWTVYVDREIQNAFGVFPVVIKVSTTGVLGTMQFTYTIAGGTKQGPVLSTAAPFGWNIPNTPFFVAFGNINYTSTNWTYTINQNGVVTGSGGAAGSAAPLAQSDLMAKLGKLIGQNSLGLNDVQFLQLIQARIRVNHSNGLRVDLAAIIGFLLDSTLSSAFFIKDFGPASVMVGAYVSINPYLIARLFLQPAAAAGVNLTFLHSEVAPASTLMFGSIYSPGFAAGPAVTGAGVTGAQSFGSIYTAGFLAGPPVTIDGGGKIAGVIQTQG